MYVCIGTRAHKMQGWLSSAPRSWQLCTCAYSCIKICTHTNIHTCSHLYLQYNNNKFPKVSGGKGGWLTSHSIFLNPAFMYVCMYACMYACAYIERRLADQPFHLFESCMYVCSCVCMYACACMKRDIMCMHVLVQKEMRSCKWYTCAYIGRCWENFLHVLHTYMYVLTYVYIVAQMLTYIFSYTHILTY